jgi:hypothetical protein
MVPLPPAQLHGGTQTGAAHPKDMSGRQWQDHHWHSGQQTAVSVARVQASLLWAHLHLSKCC